MNMRQVENEATKAAIPAQVDKQQHTTAMQLSQPRRPGQGFGRSGCTFSVSLLLIL